MSILNNKGIMTRFIPVFDLAYQTFVRTCPRGQSPQHSPGCIPAVSPSTPHRAPGIPQRREGGWLAQHRGETRLKQVFVG